MKKTISLLGLFLLIGLIVSCSSPQVIVTPPNEPVAGTSLNYPVKLSTRVTTHGPYTVSETNRHEVYYRFNIPGESGGDGVWLEVVPTEGGTLDGLNHLGLIAKNAFGSFSEYLRSDGPESFGFLSSYPATSEALSTSAIVPQPVETAGACTGPCIFVPYPANFKAGETHFAYAVLRFNAGPSFSYQIKSYAGSYHDSTESISNTCNTIGLQAITVIGAEPDYKGAIEYMTDTDCFLSGNVSTTADFTKVTIEIPAETTIALTADIHTMANGRIIATCKVTPTNRTCSRDNLDSSSGLLVRVKSTRGRAAPFVNSQYGIKFE